MPFVEGPAAISTYRGKQQTTSVPHDTAESFLTAPMDLHMTHAKDRFDDGQSSALITEGSDQGPQLMTSAEVQSKHTASEHVVSGVVMSHDQAANVGSNSASGALLGSTGEQQLFLFIVSLH